MDFLQALERFLVEGGAGPGGRTLAQLRALPTGFVRDEPELAAWLFPSDIGGESPLLVATLLRRPDVQAEVMKNYERFVRDYGAVLDHHGWLFTYGAAAASLDICKPSDAPMEILARVLRCLQLAGFQGHSSSPQKGPAPPPQVAYLYADGLRSWLLARPKWRALRSSEETSRLLDIGSQRSAFTAN